MNHFWGKIIHHNKIILSKDIKYSNDISLENQLFKCIDELTIFFDISQPVWLKKHKKEFDEFKKITFYKDDFIDDVYFDKFEIELLNDNNNNNSNNNN